MKVQKPADPETKLIQIPIQILIQIVVQIPIQILIQILVQIPIQILIQR